MNILILTPINPVIAGEVYTNISHSLDYNEKEVGFLCFPFFAEMACLQENKAYLPRLFSMLKSSLEYDLNAKLFNKRFNIVIGNSYKKQHFDLIVGVSNNISYLDKDGEEIYDSYLETIRHNEELEEFSKRIEIDNLYTLDDTEIILPSTKHLILFLEGVIK